MIRHENTKTPSWSRNTTVCGVSTLKRRGYDFIAEFGERVIGQYRTAEASGLTFPVFSLDSPAYAPHEFEG